MTDPVVIERLGGRGDGIAHVNGKPLFIPRALPGEHVIAAGSGRHVLEILKSSPERVQPFCPHYAVCGGCSMQHAGSDLYRRWKHALVAGALDQAGVTATVEPLIDAQGAGRRRLAIHTRIDGKAIRAGFMQARSHDLTDILHCPILDPRLDGAFEIARALAKALSHLGKPIDVQVTCTAGGLDVDLRGAGKLSQLDGLALADAAARLDLARLSNHGDLILMRREPVIQMGRARAIAPPGAFLQATEAAEAMLGEFALAALGASKRAADLFCGIGPFALRMAERCIVQAFDSDANAVAALTAAARAAAGLKGVSAEARDLFRRPLLPKELEGFDAVVVDPPRAGAEAQARQLARAQVPCVIYISCDAASFARDAAILTGGGYSLERVQPFDQFVYSAHVEIAAVFRKGAAR